MIRKYLNKVIKKTSKKSTSYLDMPFLHYIEGEIEGVNAYQNNAIVHRCVNLVSTSASHVPWQVFKNKDDNRELVNYHPCLNLLKHPNPEQSGADFFIESLSNLLLYGDSYLLLVLEEGKTPCAMYNLHPSLVEKNYSNNKLIYYIYSSGEGKQFYNIHPVTRQCQLLHLKNYNPTDQRNGLSALSSASQAINLYAKIMEWNKSLLQNAIRPSGALVFQDGNGYLSDDQFERLQKQFYDNFSGSNNSGKPLILEGGLKWQETSHAEKFEKFIELKDSSARDIAIAFNVPPQLLGISGDNTYSNMQEARLALWEENIIPLLDKYADALSSWFSYWYQDDLVIDFDKESISVLTGRRESLWSKISDAHFMTINEKRVLLGLSPIKDGDQLNINNSTKN
ncbi:MAG: phage portal protein [Rickettsiaceae bacterium]